MNDGHSVNRDARHDDARGVGEIEREEQFSAAFRAHYAELTRFVARRAPARIVDDVVADTFATAWRRFDDEPAHVRPWLFAIAYNVMRTQMRGLGRWEALHVRVDAEPSEPPGDLAEEVALRTDVAQAFGRLRAADQEVLSLAVWEDLDSSDAAQVLGCSARAYLVRLHRARRRLSAMLAATTRRAETQEVRR